ncbi:hypothetical protein [Achromobacter denitrificans]
MSIWQAAVEECGMFFPWQNPASPFYPVGRAVVVGGGVPRAEPLIQNWAD